MLFSSQGSKVILQPQKSQTSMYFHVCKTIIKKILRYSKHRYYYAFGVIEYGNISKCRDFDNLRYFWTIFGRHHGRQWKSSIFKIL